MLRDILRVGKLKPLLPEIVKFTSSIDYDRYIVKPVIDINRAHVVMLVERGVMPAKDGALLLKALEKLSPRMKLDPRLEDVHMNVEARVIEEVGEEVGGKLHLAKSRNDQVSAALRMTLRSFILNIIEGLSQLQRALLRRSEEHLRTIMPGYSHLQHAQPTTLASYFLAYHDSIGRGVERLKDAYDRINLSPMGAGAVSATSFPIDRMRIAELLGFDGIIESAIDAINTRDFVIEAISSLSLIMMDLSRMSEDFILWSTSEFRVVEIPDEYVSTSSIMPQKRNPVVLELIRAKTSQVHGNLTSVLSIVNTLPFGYSLDFQELNRCLWDSCEITLSSVKAMTGMVKKSKFFKDRLRELTSRDFSTATDLADFLVKEFKIPFRMAYRVVGVLVKRLSEAGKALEDLTPNLLSKVVEELASKKIKVNKKMLSDVVSPEKSVEARKVLGGPSPKAMLALLKKRKAKLEESHAWLEEKRRLLEEASRKLNEASDRIRKT